MQISISATTNSIVSLQSYVVNSIFYYLQLTEVHGNQYPDDSLSRSITVPAGSFISAAEFICDKNNNLIGLCLYFSDNSDTKYIGQGPNKIAGFTSTRYDVKSNQEIVGFFGYETSDMITALGLMVVEKNDSNFYYKR